MRLFWNLYSSKNLLKKCITVLKNIKQDNWFQHKTIRNIRMISEGSCDTEDREMAAENSALPPQE